MHWLFGHDKASSSSDTWVMVCIVLRMRWEPAPPLSGDNTGQQGELSRGTDNY